MGVDRYTRWASNPRSRAYRLALQRGEEPPTREEGPVEPKQRTTGLYLKKCKACSSFFTTYHRSQVHCLSASCTSKKVVVAKPKNVKCVVCSEVFTPTTRRNMICGKATCRELYTRVRATIKDSFWRREKLMIEQREAKRVTDKVNRRFRYLEDDLFRNKHLDGKRLPRTKITIAALQARVAELEMLLMLTKG